MLHIVDGEAQSSAKWVSHGCCSGFFYSLHILQSLMCTHKTYPTNFHGLRENLSYCKSANNPKIKPTFHCQLTFDPYNLEERTACWKERQFVKHTC